MHDGIRWSNLTVAGRIVLLALLTLVIAIGLLAQEAAKPKVYTPTEVQSLRLQNKQKDALITKQQMEALQSAMQAAQQRFSDQLKALTDEGEKTKSENGWGKEVAFDPNTLVFSEAPSGPSSKNKNPANPKN
jgi:hypothetical protein